MTLDGTRSYLVGHRQAVLLDPGPADGAQMERVQRLVEARRVRAVCLTHAHPDHAGGAERVAEELGAPVAGSRATLDRLGLDGRILEDGDLLEVDRGERALRVLATPGHASDHLSYFLMPDRALFTGDLVLGEGSAMVGHPDGNVGDYLASLERLVSLRPERLHPGHGPTVEDAVGRLEAYRRHRLEREDQIREAVGEGARSVREIRSRVYGDVPGELEWAAEASVRAHLAHLEATGAELPPIERREDGIGQRH
jgi:glyoxylase-like metal-dependent hydrolase (beta-lactamase superfamily II)